MPAQGAVRAGNDASVLPTPWGFGALDGLGQVERDGLRLTATNWQRASVVVTGTGAERLSFKDFEPHAGHAFVGEMRLIRKQRDANPGRRRWPAAVIDIRFGLRLAVKPARG